MDFIKCVPRHTFKKPSFVNFRRRTFYKIPDFIKCASQIVKLQVRVYVQYVSYRATYSKNVRQKIHHSAASSMTGKLLK
jgi:hypothetical protein